MHRKAEVKIQDRISVMSIRAKDENDLKIYAQ